MDPLSDILSLLKPRSYISAGFDAGGDWSLRLDDLAGRIKCYAVTRGSCWLSLEDHRPPLKLVAGDCFVLPSGCPVQISSDPALEPVLSSQALSPDRNGDTVIFNGGGDVLLVGSRFEVTGRHGEVLLRTLPPVIHLESAPDQAVLRGSIELMMRELKEANPGASLVAQHLAHIILVQTLRLALLQKPPHQMGWLAGLTDPQLSGALSALHENPARRWTLAGLAATVGMSRTAFARRFRDVMDETPINYLIRWRMMLAAEQLVANRAPLSEIAIGVGYESESAFTAAFGRVMGCSPRRYGLAAKRG